MEGREDITKTRSQKALINTIALGIYQLVHFVCGLILPRFFLVSFGSDYNGVISSVTQLLNFITVLQFGIAGSTRFALYKVLADNDVNGISGIVVATEKYMRKIGFVLLAYIGVLAFAYPYIASTSISAHEAGMLVLIIGASTFSQYFFGITYQILLTADQKIYIYNVIATTATVLNTVVAVILVKAGQNIFVVKLGSAIIYFLVPVILSVYVKKAYRIDKTVPQDKKAIKSRWDVMWHTVANIVHENTDLVVLTVLTSTKQVSVYTVYYLVINGIYKVLSIFTNSLEAAFGNMFAKGEKDNAYKNLELYEFFMCSFVSVVFSCALVLIVPFVKLYTNQVTDVNYIEPAFAIIAVVAQMVMCIRQPYLTVVRAAGHYKQTKNGAFAEAIINIVISVVLTYFFGIVGVAIGTLVANLFRTLQFVLYIRKNIIDRPVFKPLMMMLWTVVNVIDVCFFATQIILNIIHIDSWLDWFITGAVCVVIATTVTLFTSLFFCKNNLIKTIKTVKFILKKGNRKN